jgi:predicted transcriptional regulator
MSNKEAVIEALRELPDELSFDEIVEHLAAVAATRRGEQDAEAGRVIPHDEVKKRIASWTTK